MDLYMQVQNIYPNIFFFSAAIIYTRMQSIRNAFQKMHREAKSGSEPEGSTDRQREILRLAGFLRAHIKVHKSINSYSRGQAPTKSTPKAKSVGRARVSSSIQITGYLKHIPLCI